MSDFPPPYDASVNPEKPVQPPYNAQYVDVNSIPAAGVNPAFQTQYGQPATVAQPVIAQPIVVVQQSVQDTRVPELFDCGAKDYLMYFCIGWLFQPAAGYAIGKKLKETNLCARHILPFILLVAVIIGLIGFYVAFVVQAVYGAYIDNRKRYELYFGIIFWRIVFGDNSF